MPRLARKTISAAVKGLRGLEAQLCNRHHDYLMMIKAAPGIVIASEALSDDVASLDEALAQNVTMAVRTAVVRAGTVDLWGAAPGIDRITDDVSRLISQRQLPLIYLNHLLAAVIIGAEQGLRDLLRGTAAQPAPPAIVMVPEHVGTSAAPASPANTLTQPAATVSPTPDTGSADPLDRVSTAPSPLSGPSRGRVVIRSNSQRI